MNKRYQVFVSSTFRDLIDERQGALKAILELDHMPAGMELFPASDESAWQLIKDVIDSSDYYVLLVGGRYGSLDEEGISYTEKEYDYAVSNKTPVIPLLHKNPDNLPRDKTETNPDAWKKLKNFRQKVESKHTCVYWETAEDLKAKLIVGLTSMVKKRPAIGWVRADNVPSDASIREVLDLKSKLSEAQERLEQLRTTAPPGTEELLQGDDVFPLKVRFTVRDAEYVRTSYTATINPSWNEVFAAIAPALINEAADSSLRRAFGKFVERLTVETYAEDKDIKGSSFVTVALKDADDIDTCIVQLRALGLIKESERKRSITDTATYWTLTPFGDRQMVQLRALRREPPPKRRRGRKSATDTGDTGTGNDS